MGRGIWEQASGRRHLGGGNWEASGTKHLGEGIWGWHLRGGTWEEASGRRHLGECIWEEASGRRHLGGLCEGLREGSGVALGRLWESSGRSFGRPGGSRGSRGVWEGLPS